MADPQPEVTGTTHTYLSTAAHKDWAVVFLIGSFIFEVLQDHTFVENFVPHQYHDLIAKAMLLTALGIRFYKTKRPVAIFEGTPVEVPSLPVQTPTAVDLGKVGKLIVALMLLGGFAGCSHAPPTLTPIGVAAFHANQVVKALDVARDFAISAEAQQPKLLSTATTRKVIDFHEAAVKTIHASPGGWKPTVAAALEQLQHDILPAEWSRLLPYISLVKTLMEAV